jgi:hypothetical protein
MELSILLGFSIPPWNLSYHMDFPYPLTFSMGYLHDKCHDMEFLWGVS